MKILYFNWVPTRAFPFDGGGVSIYQKNVLNYLSKKDDMDVYYLTTSYAYDLMQKSLISGNVRNLIFMEYKSLK